MKLTARDAACEVPRRYNAPEGGRLRQEQEL